MRRLPADEAAREFYLRALELPQFDGNLAALLRAVEAESGVVYRTAAGWKEPGGGKHIPGHFLIAIHRVTGLSLDDAAVRAEPTSLEGEVRRLREQMDELLAERTEIRSRLGMPGLPKAPDPPIQQENEVPTEGGTPAH